MSGNGVTFERNGKICGIMVQNGNECSTFDMNPRYILTCISEYSYALTIPAENMTEYEEGSVWWCYYPADGRYKSPDVVLNIASKIKITYTCIITKENELQM